MIRRLTTSERLARHALSVDACWRVTDFTRGPWFLLRFSGRCPKSSGPLVVTRVDKRIGVVTFGEVDK